MLSKVSETTMHRVRWVLTLGWLLLIASLFYDPITILFTDPSNSASPFHLHPEINSDPDRCVRIREACMYQSPYEMGALIWWAMIVPAGIFILLAFGHEFWRRICPLSFVSQIPRALGMQRRQKVIDPVTGEARREVVTIRAESWLGRNHLYVQFALFILGLGIRILFINADRRALGGFLIASMLCAILVGYLYAGKSWCHYFCPMAPVQMVYTGPRSLMGSQAHLQSPPAVTQSVCRATDEKGGPDRNACVGCKAPCIDIDAEKTYWMELNKPGRRLVQYGYLAMVIGFYLYYYLYAGNWDYYFTGAWTHEDDQISKLFDTGFYINGVAIPIPKFIAVFITFFVLVGIFFLLGIILEHLYRRYRSRPGRSVSKQQAQHIIFTLFTITSFWTFFSYGARPSLNRLPTYPLLAFNALVVLVGSMWMFRTFGRTYAQYERESMSSSLRKQLQKLKLSPSQLGGRSLDQLTADEVYTLVKVLPNFSQTLRQQTYAGILTDLLEQKVIDVAGSYSFLEKLRQELQIDDMEHFTAIEGIAALQPDLLVEPPKSPASPIHDAITLARRSTKRA